MAQAIYCMRKNDREEIRMDLKEYKEKPYIDIRVYFTPEGGDEMIPTKRGITVAPSQLSEFVKGLKEVANVMQAQKQPTPKVPASA